MVAPERWITHVDLDAFFASVEELLDPSLRGKPIVVGGSPEGRGVVASASYAARAYGVRSAMPVAQALRLCPRLIVVSHHFSEYETRSRSVMDILRQITPVVEQLSVDEAFLDVTGCERMLGPVEEIGQLIQRRVLTEQQLPVSLGIGSSKLVAKVACSLGKPNGLVIVPQGGEAQFLAPLPITKLWGVGDVTASRLGAIGVETIGDLADVGEDRLVALFGAMGHSLHANARGIDQSGVHASRERRSISQERTFAQDTGDRGTIHRMLLGMSESLASGLRARHLVAHTVRIKLRYPDFTTHTRQATLDHPTDQGEVINASALDLMGCAWRTGQLLRLLGLAVSGLDEAGGYQLDLFERTDQRRIRLNQAIDEIRDKYGRKAIVRASLLRKRVGEVTKPKP